MAHKEHRYAVRLDWTGNLGTGTSSYRAYSRDHTLSAGTKPAIPATSDAAFRGDPARWNPEEMLVGALSSCHQLWYLHLCSAAGIVVTGYSDDADGMMEEETDGGGQFTAVVLRPRVTLAPGPTPARRWPCITRRRRNASSPGPSISRSGTNRRWRSREKWGRGGRR